MGQKVSPHGLRVGVIKDWESKWYASDKDFGDNLVEDYKIREFLKKRLFNSGIASIEIEKKLNKVYISLHAAKPGIIIGKGGAEIDKLRADVEKLIGNTADVFVYASVVYKLLVKGSVVCNVKIIAHRRVPFGINSV